MWADPVAQARFLLTAIKNDVDGETLGASLYELALIPDFRLFDDPALAHARIHRNLNSVRKLTYSDLSIRGRVLDLRIGDKQLLRRITQYLVEIGVDNPYSLDPPHNTIKKQLGSLVRQVDVRGRDQHQQGSHTCTTDRPADNC